ncbi:hypothetical protein AAFC00_006094 [Neodothiora populina]|uniref:Major facilitator superfamily (MFS) profile domain-containing protein n=1 Tax=Neodothiora populina TaxID=2781224 RepID=A0ABR3P708_9PEZI
MLNDHEKGLEGTIPTAEMVGDVSPVEEEHKLIHNAYPDGGREAWLTVGGAWCCNFASFGWTSSVGVFQTYYSQNQLSEYSSSTVSWIPSANLFMLLVLAPVFGKLFDSYGPRWIIVFGTIVDVLGLMFLSLSDKYYQIFLSQSIFSGIGSCALFYAGMNAVSTYFQKKRALAIGIVASASSLGGVIVPIMFNNIIDAGVSFGWTIRIIAFTFLALLSFACVFTKSRLDHKPKPLIIMDFIRPLKEVPFLFLTAAGFFAFWGIFIPNNFIVLYAQSIGMSVNLSNYQLVVLNAASIFGRVGCGLVADRFGRINTIIINLVLVTVFVLALWLIQTEGTTIAFSTLYGFGSGSFISLLPAIIAQVSDIREIGVRTGIVYFVSAFACLTGNPIGSALIENNSHPYRWMQVFSAIIIFIGAGFFTLLRLSQSRKLTARV